MELRGSRGPRTVARVREVLDDPIAPARWRDHDPGRAAGDGRAQSLGLIRHWNPRRAITVEADLDKGDDRYPCGEQSVARGVEKIRARYPATNLDFSGELDDINESLEAMGPLFLLGVGLIYLIWRRSFAATFSHC